MQPPRGPIWLVQTSFIFLILKAMLTATYVAQAGEPAVVIAPVMDAVLKSQEDAPFEEAAYAQLPCSTEKGEAAASRVHQFLFNEVVDITEESKDEACIEPPNLLFLDKNKHLIHYKFWCLKKYLKKLDTFDQSSKQYIPEPLTRNESVNTGHVVLKEPWAFDENEAPYSAGTRFVKDPSFQSEHAHKIYFLENASKQIRHAFLPKEKSYSPANQTNAERIRTFTELLKRWTETSQTQAVIPYVWGGCSFTHRYSPDFQLVDRETQKTWERYKPAPGPYAGFDCSGLVLRAAQIAGLPYWSKNTTTLKQSLSPLGESDSLSEGDLIWTPGHVMVVVDLVSSLVVESRGYASGFGKVQMIAIKDVFKNVKTLEELASAYRTQKPLQLIDKHGKVVKEIPEFSILKLPELTSTQAKEEE